MNAVKKHIRRNAGTHAAQKQQLDQNEDFIGVMLVVNGTFYRRTERLYEVKRREIGSEREFFCAPSSVSDACWKLFVITFKLFFNNTLQAS